MVDFLNSFLVEITGAVVALGLSLLVKEEKWKFVILVTGVIVVLGLLANKTATEQKTANTLDGTWIGEVYQEDLDISYSTVLILKNCLVGSYCGSVSYPDLHCGGSLILDESSSTSIRLNEDITYGNPRCVEGITINLTWIEGTTWGAEYIFDEELVAEGRLIRDH